MLISTMQTVKHNLVKQDEYIKFVLDRLDDIKTSALNSILSFSKTLPSYLKYKNNDIVCRFDYVALFATQELKFIIYY